MRPFGALSLVSLLALAGCITVSGRVGAVSDLDDVAERINAQQGTDFSGSMTTTGYGVGGEMYGMFGAQLARTVAAQTSTATSGETQELRVEQADVELNLAYPIAQVGPIMLSPGLSLTHRTTGLRYLRDGDLATFDDETALILRPHLKVVTSVGAHAIVSAGAGYEFAFLEDPVGGPGGGAYASGSAGPQANVTLTYFFCSGCVGK